MGIKSFSGGRLLTVSFPRFLNYSEAYASELQENFEEIAPPSWLNLRIILTWEILFPVSED